MTPFSTLLPTARTSATRRWPVASRSQWTTRSKHEATVGSTKALLMLSPASRGRVQILVTASRAELACSEHIPGSPAFRAMSMSRLSASRTSPTTSRSGRIRSASFTSRRSGISPVPSRFAWRHCMATTSRSATLSSKTSSTVTTRSRGPMAAHRQLSMVVFPACVAPETRILSPEATAACRKSAACVVSEPSATRSCSLRARATNLRMFTAQWARVTSGMTTCSREPSGRDASTKGELRSRRRPEDFSIRSTSVRTWDSLNARLVSSDSPPRAT